jgi:polysaccharide pyruvyl transferase WcaK-like protein
MAFDAIGLHDQAIEPALRATETAPDDPYGWSALGVTYFRLDRAEEAIAPLQRALDIRPKWAEIRGTLGNALMALGRHPESVIQLERGITDAPQMASLWASLGAAKRELREVEAAEAAFAKADALAPDTGKYGLSLALTQIRQKKLDEGWRNYDRRWNTLAFKDQTRPHTHVRWDGSDLRGKKILVYAEQGVGDETMFAGYLQALVDQGAAVFLEVTNRLAALMQRSLPGVQVGISQNPPLSAFGAPDFDWQIPAGALASFLTPAFEDFRPRGAYLKASPEQVAQLRQRYQASVDGGPQPLIVGISWRSGNPTGGKRRSASLDQWAPILQTPGVRFVNLQYGECAEEIAEARAKFGADIIEDASIDSSGMLDMFAAQVRAMDLVVSIDNSSVHFAGALGVPTFMMLNYEPDWRWFGGDEGNPWYESVAHVRQQDFDDWAPVLEAAAEVVRAAATTGALPAATHPLRPAMVNTGAKPKALLANDTTAWYHWGCTETSLAIRDQIRAKGYDLAATPIRSIYMARPAPASLQDLDDPAFFDAFTAANPHLIRQAVDADLIVVNGEGTLHGVTDNVRGLLYFAYAAARKLGKRVQIINHSCYPEDTATLTDPVANGLYKRVYETLEYAAFREHISFGLMRQIGVEGALAFDSLPLTAKAMADALPKLRERRVVIAGGASADDRAAAAFAEYARWVASQGWNVAVLTGARAFPSGDEAAFTRALTRYGLPAGAEIIQADSVQQWLGEIARAGIVTTGRFHHSIAAFATGAPLVAASSNTAKTNAIMQLLEKPEPLPIRAPDLAARLIDAHQAALDNQEHPSEHDARLEAVLTLAQENYAAL